MFSQNFFFNLVWEISDMEVKLQTFLTSAIYADYRNYCCWLIERIFYGVAQQH
jgi:hypothetical protein